MSIDGRLSPGYVYGDENPNSGDDHDIESSASFFSSRLSTCRITSVTSFQHLANLETLDLSHNEIDSVSGEYDK